jgi:two-component system nitrate/nitrite response regulator NarL
LLQGNDVITALCHLGSKETARDQPIPGAFLGLREEKVSSEKLPVRVLVVDDFEPWLRFVKAALYQESDMQIVGTAPDGLEAVAKAQVLQPDLILMDISLPALNGIEATRKISRLVPDAKIIFLSLEKEPEIVKSALAAGGRGYIAKLDAHRELPSAMKVVADGNRYVSRSCRASI